MPGRSLGDALLTVRGDTSKLPGDVQKGAEKAAQSADGALSKVGAQNFEKVGTRLTAGITLPLAGIASVAINSQAQFETAMNVMQVTSGASDAQMKTLSDTAIKLGADTVFSAGEAADAMLELAKGGFKPAQIAGGGVQATMALAATEGLNLADSATIVSDAMNTFGLKAKDATKIADALAGGSNASSASVASLAQGLGNVSSVAAASGLKLNETVAALTALDKAGIKGAEGGTALRTVLLNLNPTTDKAIALQKKYGLSFFDSKGNMLDMAGIAGVLQTKLGGLDQQTRNGVLSGLFGSFGVQAATVLFNEGETGIKKYTKATEQQGTAQQLADARMKGTAGAIEQMKGSLETAALQIGTVMAPYVVDLAHNIGDLASKFGGLSPEMQKTVVVVGAGAAALGPLLLGLGVLIRTLSLVGSGFGAMFKAAKLFGSGVGAAVTGTKNLVAGLRSAQAAQSAFTGKMGTLGGAIRSTGTAFVSGTRAAASWAASTARAAASTVVSATQATMVWVRSAAVWVAAMARAGAAAVAQAARASAAWVASTARTAAAMVAGAATATAAMVASVARQVAAWVLLGTQSLLQAARVAAAWLIAMGPIGLVIAIVVALVIVIIKNWDTIKAVTVKVFGAIVSFLVAVGHKIINTITSFVMGVVNFVKAHWPLLLAILTGPIGLAVLVLAKNWDKIVAGAKAVYTKVRSVFVNIAHTAATYIGNVVTAVKELPGKLLAFGGRLASAGTSLMRRFLEGFKAAASGVGSLVGSVVSSVTSAIKGVVNSMIDRINSSLSISIDWPGPGSFNWQAHIPHLATGTNNFAGGMARVGEHGPETVILPPGSQVVPTSRSVPLTGGGETNYYDITVEVGLEDLRDLASLQDFLDMLRMARVSARRTGRSGAVTA
jgi:TP901 family phage tail tape measure protein